MGRAKAENPKNKTVKARLDKETYNKLVEYCRRTGVTRTDVVREGIEIVVEGALGHGSKDL